MHKTTLKPLVAAILATPLLVTAAAVRAAEDEDVQKRIEKLESELIELKGQVSQNSQQAPVTQQDLDEVRVVKKGTKLTYGGYIKLDAMFSEYSGGKPGDQRSLEEFLIPSKIPVELSSGDSDPFTSTNFHAKESRFNFGTTTGTDVGIISTFIELDFILSSQGNEIISNSQASRLRHAFVKWQYGEHSSFLAGQTWSLFFNAAALPDLLDFVGPVGTIFHRQPQVRWTTGGLTVSLENPYSVLNRQLTDKERDEQLETGETNADAPKTEQSDAEKIPDLVIRYDGSAGGFSYALIGLVRQLSYETRASGGTQKTADDEALGYGLNFSGVAKFGRDDIRFSALYGNALGRYFAVNGFNDGYIDGDGEVKTFNQYGGFIAYRHFWTDRLRSSFSYSEAHADNPGNAFGNAVANESVAVWAKTYRSAHVNLNYMPHPALQIGGELIWASKELENGRDGDMKRVQASVKYAF